MNDKQTVEEAFLKIRQNVIDEMFEGKRPVLKRLTEVSQNTLEIKCMQQAYQLGQSSQQGWISIHDQLPIRCADVLVSDIESDIVCIGFLSDTWVTGVSGCDVTHWMSLPNPPTHTNKDTQNS